MAREASETSAPRPRIAVFAGPTATIQNSPPLVTSNKAREKYGLPPRTHDGGQPLRFDALRPQRLAAPVTVYVEQFSAHPLERDVAHLYAPPDGYLDASGTFHRERTRPSDVPVYEVTLRPQDGLYPLPYMGRQADGRPWEEDCAFPGAPAGQARQPFYPDPSRVFEEIDRLGVGEEGVSSLLAAKADYDFFRAAPSGGYTGGLPAAARTDVGEGDIPPERAGEDFFGYRPTHLQTSPSLVNLARLTNVVQRAMASGRYAGGIWLEGSPSVEETSYWLGLLIDTAVPIVGNASQRAHGTLSNDGDHNIVDSAEYIRSRIWADESGRDSVGAVVIQDEQIFSARDVQKGDARPGGYIATGGHGGIVGSMGLPGPAVLTYRPARRSTWRSAVSLPQIPREVCGAAQTERGPIAVVVQVKDEAGDLLPPAMPAVTIVKTARFLPEEAHDPVSNEADILARIEQNLRQRPLAGFVAEGTAPFAGMTDSVNLALRRAALCGMPFVRVGRGNAEGFAPPPRPRDLAVMGSNLTATKARLLLMACMLRLGALPPAANPDDPTESEIGAIRAKLAEYQAVFDTH